MQTKSIELGKIARITAGYPFRGAIRPTPGADAAVVQIKNIDAECAIDWPSLVKTKLQGRRQPDWLKAGDILFSARGHRNVAVYVDQPPVNAVCSPHFFLIRIRNQHETLPEFIAWQMNLPRSQRYFAQSATGSFITSIRRQVLERVPLRLPSLSNQHLLARFSTTVRHEKEVLNRMIENRKQELNAVAMKLLD